MLNFLDGMLLTGGATTSAIDWSTIITSSSFDGMLDGIGDVLPVVVPVALTIVGIPVVWKLTKRFIKG